MESRWFVADFAWETAGVIGIMSRGGAWVLSRGNSVRFDAVEELGVVALSFP